MIWYNEFQTLDTISPYLMQPKHNIAHQCIVNYCDINHSANSALLAK